MQYDVLLTHTGDDTLSVALAVMSSIQQLTPLPVLDVNEAKHWLEHVPILLRRGIAGDDARAMQQQFEQLGAAVALVPTKLFFPKNASGITRWRNEWFSEHLMALRETVLTEWAKDIDEAYRFSLLPSQGADLSLRFWFNEDTVQASARRSIGTIGPLPGPPAHIIDWKPEADDWQTLKTALQKYRFWESRSWNTVPDGYMVLDGTHWVFEGWRNHRYHVLTDNTPNEGAAREMGILLLDLVPDYFLEAALE